MVRGDVLLLWGLFGDISQPGLPGKGHPDVRLLQWQLPLACTKCPQCWCLARKKMKEVPRACGLVVGDGKRTAKRDGCKRGCGASWRSRGDIKVEKHL